MIPEPLKNKGVLDPNSTLWNYEPIFQEKDIKSAVSGLIKFHEDRIKKLKKLIEESESELKIRRQLLLDSEKEATNAIEHWLEDVI